MPKEKKTMKLRDQKPIKDPQGGRKGNHGNKHLNTGGTNDAKDNRHHRGGGHSHF